jgi:hypothetical protein
MGTMAGGGWSHSSVSLVVQQCHPLAAGLLVLVLGSEFPMHDVGGMCMWPHKAQMQGRAPLRVLLAVVRQDSAVRGGWARPAGCSVFCRSLLMPVMRCAGLVALCFCCQGLCCQLGLSGWVAGCWTRAAVRLMMPVSRALFSPGSEPGGCICAWLQLAACVHRCAAALAPWLHPSLCVLDIWWGFLRWMAATSADDDAGNVQSTRQWHVPGIAAPDGGVLCSMDWCLILTMLA